VAKTSSKKVIPSLAILMKTALPNETAAPWLKACKVLTAGPQIKHVFTHRRLWIQIWEISTKTRLEPDSENLKWISLTQLGRYGLPQPIKVLLQGLSLVHDGDLKN